MEDLFRRVDQSTVLSQSIPLVLTVVILGVLLSILHASLALLNQIPGTIPILLVIRPQDVIVGATIYLKTEIDFAILIGRLMDLYPGWRNRVALEIGSAVGNAGGTILVIGIWVLLKHVDLLLALMVIVASLVLFELAHSGLEYLTNWESGGGIKKWIFLGLHKFLDATGVVINPLLSRIIPDLGERLRGKEGLSWRQLTGFSTEIPFILGLDDFAGYVPLFNVVNVYGFAAGVIGAHTLLNICLFLSPKRTINAVKNEYVSFLGTMAFIGLGTYGLLEAGKIIVEMF
jgi:hypothetical protein